MTISKVAYVQTSSLKQLEKDLDKLNIDYSHHTDGCEEKETWVQFSTHNHDDLIRLCDTYLNYQENQKCAEENVEYIIFYE